MRMDRRSISRLVLGAFMLFLLIYWFMFTGQQLLTAARPILIGAVIAFPLNILIGFFKKHDFLYHRKLLQSERGHQILATVLAVIVLAGCVVFIGGYLAPQLTASAIALLERVPQGIRFLLYQPLVGRLIPAETMETLQKFDWNNWINHLVNMVSSDDLFRNMTVTATTALSAFSNLLFGILFACYFLSGKDTALRTAGRLVRAFVPASRQETVFRSASLLNECFRSFIVCQVIQAMMIGLSATILMSIFGFPYASMVGSLNGFCALIPVIGGYLGAILGTLMILTDAPGQALLFLVFIVVLQNVIGTLVFPRLIGRTLQLPSVWTLSAVLIGSGLGGIMGIMIGVPLTAFAYRLIRERLEERERMTPEELSQKRDVI